MTEKADLRPEVLDECLTRVLSGAASLEACLESYPQFAAEIESLLKLAVQTHISLAPPSPTKMFQEASRTRVINRLRARLSWTHQKSPSRRRQLRWRWRPAYAFTSLAFALLILAGTAGAAYASSSAIPGDRLYPVKRSVEEIRLVLTWTSIGDLALFSDFVDERLEELALALDQGRDDAIQPALLGYTAMMDRLLNRAGDLPDEEMAEMFALLEREFTQHEGVLQDVLSTAPPEAQEGIQSALEHSGHGKAVLEHLKSGGSPSDLAPGQLKKTPGTSENADDREQEPKKTKTPKPDKKEKSHGPPPWANAGDDEVEED